MRRLTLVLLSTFALGGILAGCGDNKAASTGDGSVDGVVVGGDGGILPVCTVTKPIPTTTHPTLNGVPVANGGDRVSSPGGAYEVEFDVTTNIEDGQTVELRVTNAATTSMSTVIDVAAMTGKAVFAGVTLSPDGTYDVQATCTNKAGHVGQSTKGVYPVDSTPPDLTISSPADGTFFGPAQLTAGAFKVCAQTKAADAVNLPATLGAAAVKNLSVAIGTASPDPTTGFVAVTTVSTDACVNVTCTSSSPVDLTVTLKDAAGNPTVKTISQISCATMLPGVQIISPAGDTAPFSDPTKHLLAANSTNTFKDQDSTKTGGQWTVVACSDKAGMATLLGGAMGGTLAAIGTAIPTVAAVGTDNCPAGHTQVAKFTNATIPDSALNADGTLSKATGLEVDVTDASTAVGKSPEVDFWAASSAPSVANNASSPICNTVVQSTVDVTKSVILLSSTPTVTLTVTGSSGATMYTAPAFQGGNDTFSGVVLKLGTNTLTAVASDKAGNSSTLAQPCTVQVGTPPVVTFTNPPASENLCAAGNASGTCVPDSTGATAGWQGSLTVGVTVQGAPATSGTVTFTASSATAPLGMATIGASGTATLTGITIPDGNPVTITATTSAIGANGAGTVSRTIVVDTTLPSAPASLTAVVKDRRQTSFTLSWTAPADGTGVAVAGYDIRYSLMPITAANFAAATIVPSAGSPQAPGMPETRDVTGLLIENNYFFALTSTDAAGNVSAIVTATPSPMPASCTTPPCPIRASFNQTVITGPLPEGLGYYVDGSGNFTGDANSDILAGEWNGSHAYMFAGAANFTSPAPAVTFSGATFFGGSIANIGDVDGDGLEDIAISSYGEAKVYIYKGRATWSATLADTDATYTITADAPSGIDSSSVLGYPIVKLGDINGDGVGDFGMGAAFANSGAGAMVVVLGATTFGGGNLSAMTAANRAVVIPAPATALQFGSAATGLGAQSGTLVVGALTGGTGMGGQLFSFDWAGTPAAGTLAQIGSPYAGPAGAELGFVLNVLGGASGIIAGTGIDPEFALGFFGGAISNPLAVAPIKFTEFAASQGFGNVALGGGFSGSNLSISFIGDSHPDLVLAPAKEEGNTAPIVYILDGSQVVSLVSPVDVTTAAQVQLRLPADWNQATLYNSSIKDINGDGYGDIAIGETGPYPSESLTPPVTPAGRIVVLW